MWSVVRIYWNVKGMMEKVIQRVYVCMVKVTYVFSLVNFM